jgi:DNA polymerase-3 subunit epsilon
MRLARDYLPYAPRSLADCCTVAGWTNTDAHTALADARAAARLLACYLDAVNGDEPWLHLLDDALTWPWPTIPVSPAGRGVLPRDDVAAQQERLAANGADERHFLARLVPALPRVPDPPMADPYLSVLDDVLADRKIDTGEADALVALAEDLGLDRPTVEELHLAYLTSLARAAWEDGIISELEHQDLDDVALLLGLPSSAVEQALDAGRTFTGGDVPIGTLRLSPGDRLCFTGEMSMPRSDLQGLALAAGLDVSAGVSKKTTMLVCADADSLSGKARKARDLGVTVISEPKFHQLLAAMDGR